MASVIPSCRSRDADAAVNRPLEPVYTKRQCQRCNDNSAMMLRILFSSKTMESPKIRVTTHF